MNPQQRVEAALEFARQAFVCLRDWKDETDPAEQRRLRVVAAKQYRTAADLLDDSERLMP